MTEIQCEKCRTRYTVSERLLKEAGTAQATCRKCGASIAVSSRGEEVPLTQEDIVGRIDSQVALDRFLAGICEPDDEAASFPDAAPPRFELPPRRHRLGAPARKPSASLEPAEQAAARPREPERPARLALTYTVSRPAVLSPGTLAENRCVAFFPDAPEMEPYRVLRTQVLQAAEMKGGNTVMVTSALPLEGKTLTSVNLALTFSKAYLETALLVDCDLRQQRIREVLGIESGRGLGDYLTGGCAVPDMMVWPGVDKLTVVSGGRKVSESSELLGSPAMKALVEDLKGRYPNRYVFFDVPSVLTGADALAFAPLADHILFVVRAGSTPVPEARKALAMLPREKVIGLVLNRQDACLSRGVFR